MTGRRRLLVGVVLHTDVAATHATLDALATALRPDDRVVLVPDGPDRVTAAALRTDARLAALTQLAVDRPQGNPAAFNRLARALADDEGALVFLENGAQVAADALDLLAAALDRPGVGMSGPSTNDAWNEQRSAPHSTGNPDDDIRSLGPLHAPAELCIAVSREAVAAVGAADEGFGLGPCWEMEYAARATRAGHAAVWVTAAYVHRAPPTRRRRRHEARSFDAAKQRYQDRLCGLRLDGTRTHYADHCAGDTCPHFAPPDRIVVNLPLGSSGSSALSPVLGTGSRSPARDPVPRTERGAQPPCGDADGTAPARKVAKAAAGRVPFVSCVLPTFDRAEWLAQAIEYFHRQDHPADARELIVVDDGPRDLSDDAALGDLLGHPAVTYLRLPRRTSIGVKRNLGFQRARGDILAQWDDDDWYGPDRLSRQLEPIAAGTADITGLRGAIWFDVDRWRFRLPTAAHHRRLFVEDVSGGTLVFARKLWDRGLRYPDASLAEDAAFLKAAVRRGHRLARLPADGAYLYVRHGTNSWNLHPRYERTGWTSAREPDELLHRPDDRAFYATRSRVAPATPRRSTPAVAPAVVTGAPASTPVAEASDEGPRSTVPDGGSRPTVSCIMPTADRHDFLPGAIAGFLAQRCDDAELVIVDDGQSPAGHLVPDDPRVRYIRLDKRHVLGEKRNLAVEAAVGDIIVHLDDDDWSHPDRLQAQADLLRSGSADVCGLARMLWWDPRRRAAWRYTCPTLRRPWVAGNTLAYTRDTWRRSHFPAQDLGEDTAFVWGDRRRRVVPLDDERLVVGTLHPGNTSRKHTRSSTWSRVDPSVVLRLFAEAESPRALDRSAQ